jgi:2-polyprenyl-3-methyl-5-hydroxy-6-metoxy-1,4-benzoquinol methylase
VSFREARVEKVTDWVLLWRQLVESQAHIWKNENAPDEESDNWKNKARSFSEGVKRRRNQPDLHRDFVLATLRANPDSTVLDIGAGTGGWAIPMARHAKKVTALEPSPGMIAVLQENVEQEGIRNIEIVRGGWPDTVVAPHDYSLCSHAMYGVADLPAFVNAMSRVTRKTCLMLTRAPDHDGTLAEMALRIWGQPHDSTNFQVAYNALLQIGIYANVLMGKQGQWEPWSNASFEEAMAETRRRFKVPSPSEHDAFLNEMLKSRLTCKDGRYYWPSEVRSALIYWEGSASA